MRDANARVQKWGNSLALRIPQTYAREIGLRHNSAVRIHLEAGRLVIEPMPRFDLDELLAAITPDNQHGEIDTGAAVGSEVW
ncbi:MAG: AbrB/MazE/SpoVT family DNA-binding domain-containing protein [Chloroflexota bacterium]|jgi:antitoxin MazE